MRHHELVDFHTDESTHGAGPSFLRIVLLFGSIAIAMGLILVPIMTEQADRQLTETLFENQPDYTLTGSISRNVHPATTAPDQALPVNISHGQ